MPIANFHVHKDAYCQMSVFEDQIRALTPQGQGIVIPFRFDPTESEAPRLQTWDISYIYAELWVDRALGSHLIAAALPEFYTDSYRPTTLRFPLTAEAASVLEEVRAGGDLRLTLHLQATIVGTASLDRVPDPERRRTLEAWGLDREIIGPLRSFDGVNVRITKLDWEEEILPQWSQKVAGGVTSDAPAMQRRGGHHLDIRAVARTLYRATPDADFDRILEQCRAPIVGL